MADGVKMSPGERVLEAKLSAVAEDIAEIKEHLKRLNGSVADNVSAIAESEKRIALIEQRCLQRDAEKSEDEPAKWKALGPIILAVAAILSTLSNLLPEIVHLLAR